MFRVPAVSQVHQGCCIPQGMQALKKAKHFEIRKIKRRMKEGQDTDKLQRQHDIAKALDLSTLTNELAAESGWEARMPAPSGVKGASGELNAVEQTVHDRIKRARVVQDEVCFIG